MKSRERCPRRWKLHPWRGLPRDAELSSSSSVSEGAVFSVAVFCLSAHASARAFSPLRAREQQRKAFPLLLRLCFPFLLRLSLPQRAFLLSFLLWAEPERAPLLPFSRKPRLLRFLRLLLPFSLLFSRRRCQNTLEEFRNPAPV